MVKLPMNVSKNYYSPLRYPGGKARLLPFIKELIKKNNLFDDRVYIEPYVGGGGVALGLLFDGFVKEIIINDFDVGVYSFWKSIIDHNDDFVRKLLSTEISVKEWKKQNEIYRDGKIGFDLGFATFFLNRCNYSGVITGGCIGGLNQDGSYKIDCRFNKDSLTKRIMAIKQYRKKIKVFNYDAVNLLKIKKLQTYVSDSLLYLDPPYFVKGKELYKNHYTIYDHSQIAETIKSANTHWLVSYDNTKEIKSLYKGYRKIEFGISHYAGNFKQGKEVIFFSKNFSHVPKSLSLLSS